MIFVYRWVVFLFFVFFIFFTVAVLTHLIRQTDSTWHHLVD